MGIKAGLILMILGAVLTLVFLLLLILLPGHFRKKRKELLYQMEEE